MQMDLKKRFLFSDIRSTDERQNILVFDANSFSLFVSVRFCISLHYGIIGRTSLVNINDSEILFP